MARQRACSVNPVQDVIVQSILGNEGLDLALSKETPRGPFDSKGDQLDVIGVTLAHRRVADGPLDAISDALAAGVRQRVKVIRGDIGVGYRREVSQGREVGVPDRAAV